MQVSKLTIVSLVAFVLAGCTTLKAVPDPQLTDRERRLIAQVPDHPLDPIYERYEVVDPTGEAPGTIVVDTKQHFLYFILPNNRAIRYGVATGADDQAWTGTSVVARKAKWPHWMPPASMVARWPELRPTAEEGGLKGGPDNPLGARALYLYQDGRDTLYRIHGTNEPETIGHEASSGCIRMRNIDVIDLYERVALGAKVIVR
jgi:lipoprotein-anchoring transpeptidase ErfK/SrfK